MKDKINFYFQFIWVNQLVQSDSLKEIHFYLIYLNNDQWVIQEIKNKLKHINNFSKTIFYKVIIIIQSIDYSKSDQSKLHDMILTNIKKVNVLVKICFIYHKSNHSFKECFKKCLNQFTRINVVNNEYDHFDFDSNFDSKN